GGDGACEHHDEGLEELRHLCDEVLEGVDEVLDDVHDRSSLSSACRFTRVDLERITMRTCVLGTGSRGAVNTAKWVAKGHDDRRTPSCSQVEASRRTVSCGVPCS